MTTLQKLYYELATRWDEMGASALAEWCRSWARNCDWRDPHHWGHMANIARDIAMMTLNPRDEERAVRMRELARHQYQLMFGPYV